jgi:hypothetical protein
MCRSALLVLLASLSFAQEPPAPTKPAAAVDEALRARIGEFYQLHVTEQYRKAEKLVAEDSQDIYYVHNKPKYLSWEIRSIDYTDNFTKAKVMTMCDQTFNGPGFQGKVLKVPSISTWKVVDGQWFWFVDPVELTHGPFGKPGTPGAKPAKPGDPAPAVPDKIPTTFDFVMGQVKFEKDTLVVKPNETYQVAIESKAAGMVSLVIAQIMPGFEVTVDKANLNPGEKCIVTFKTNDNPHIGVIAFRVNPTGEIITIQTKRQ